MQTQPQFFGVLISKKYNGNYKEISLENRWKRRQQKCKS